MKLGPYLNKLFGTAYIKNLKTSIDRLNHVIKECESIDLHYTIVEAVDGREYCDENYTIQHGRHTIKYPASAGYLGVTLTSEQIVAAAIESKKKCIMVFDDDCVFSHTNNMRCESIGKIETDIPNDWDIIILGTISAGPNYKSEDLYYLRCPGNSYAAGSHGIVINERIYQEYYQFLKEKNLWGDAIIGHFIDIGKKIYLIVPSICQQNRLIFSDINKCYLTLNELGTAVN